MTGPDIGASIRARLLVKAKAGGKDFNLVLTRYALKRLLYSVGRIQVRRALPPRGPCSSTCGSTSPHRPTRDADLLGFGPAEIPVLGALFRELCAAVIEPEDGIRFQAETVRAEEIRKEANYGGIRVTFQRRATQIPNGVPFGLIDVFAEDPRKQTQWRAFLAREE